MKRVMRHIGLGIAWTGLGFYSARTTLMQRFPPGPARSTPLPSSGQWDEFTPSVLSRLLAANHVRQFNPASCSAAAAVTVINTLGEYLDPRRAHHKISQAELLENIRTVHWKERVGRRGYKGRRGLPLNVFGGAMEAALDTYEIPVAKIDVVAFQNKDPELQSKTDRLHEHLIRFAEGAPAVIVAHFDQGMCLPGLHLPHISPVGAFDPETRRVLLLDVDPSRKSPYWTPFSVFVEGLAGDFGGWLKRYGYEGGGYVRIVLRHD